MFVVNDDGADGNVRLATILLSAMARIREDPIDPVGIGLRWIGEELSRHVLQVIA
jgi:hypothetical protein